MAWVAVNKDGIELVFINKPIRCRGFWWDLELLEDGYDTEICLPKGSIKKLISRDLSWEDEPVELKEE